MEKVIGIYMIRNKTTGKIYIGQSVNIYSRFKSHKNYLRAGKHHNEYLQNSWNKYGEEDFEFLILEETMKETLYQREHFYMKSFNSCFSENGFNIETLTGEENRKIIHPETGKKISAANKGHETSEETRKKISLSKIGNPSRTGMKNSPESRKKLSESAMGNQRWLGRKHSEETKRKMSELAKGKRSSERKINQNPIGQLD